MASHSILVKSEKLDLNAALHSRSMGSVVIENVLMDEKLYSKNLNVQFQPATLLDIIESSTYEKATKFQRLWISFYFVCSQNLVETQGPKFLINHFQILIFFENKIFEYCCAVY